MKLNHPSWNFIFALVFSTIGFTNCTKDEQPIEEVVQPKVVDEPSQPETDPTKEDVRFSPERIHFDFDKYDIKSEFEVNLQNFAEYLNTNQKTVVIEGHCDERGTTGYNLALGERRANSVKNFLANLGVDANRLSTRSYGEETPLDTGKNTDSYRLNRRAEFIISD
jgi:peptidoglycan-associated lipoprotein